MCLSPRRGRRRPEKLASEKPAAAPLRVPPMAPLTTAFASPCLPALRQRQLFASWLAGWFGGLPTPALVGRPGAPLPFDGVKVGQALEHVATQGHRSRRSRSMVDPQMRQVIFVPARGASRRRWSRNPGLRSLGERTEALPMSGLPDPGQTVPRRSGGPRESLMKGGVHSSQCRYHWQGSGTLT